MSTHAAYLDALAQVTKRNNEGESYVDIVKRRRKFKSKYRHKSKFPSSNGHRGISFGGLPKWVSILIIIGIIIVTLFVASAIYYYLQERRRAQETGKSIRWKKILWNATKIALFLWIPILIVKSIKNCFKGRSSKSGGDNTVVGMSGSKGRGFGGGFITSEKGRYAEIEEDEQRLNAASAEPSPKPWRMSDPASDNDVDSRYEPMSYKPNVYNPYAAYAGAEPLSRGRSASNVSNTGMGATLDGPPVVVSPPATGDGLHQPPPPMESGDLGSQTPSPHQATFNNPGPAPAYYG